jgi:hypothetical protein
VSVEVRATATRNMCIRALVELTLLEEDGADFHALPPLAEVEFDDFEPPSAIATDMVTGRAYWMARALCDLGCDGRAYAEHITESWEAFLAKEGDLDEGEDGLTSTCCWFFTPGEDDSSIVNATLLVCDNGVALVTELPRTPRMRPAARCPPPRSTAARRRASST